MREWAKMLARGGARLLALPVFFRYRLGALITGREKAFHGASQRVSLIPGVLGEYVRREFYRMSLESCSEDCCISFGTILSKPGARIGRRVYLGPGCTLGLVTLEDDVLLGSNVDILSGAEQHRFEDVDTPIREQGGTFNRITIGADTWIGNRAVVLADVGARCVIGAASVVTRALPEGCLAVGSPARVVGKRGEDKRAEREGAGAGRPGGSVE